MSDLAATNCCDDRGGCGCNSGCDTNCGCNMGCGIADAEVAVDSGTETIPCSNILWMIILLLSVR